MDSRHHDDPADRDQWDNSEVQVHPPVKNSRAVVSVAFSREDFNAVSQEAESRGKKTSEFIRESTLERIRPHSGAMFHVSVTGPIQTSSPRRFEEPKVVRSELHTNRVAVTT
jgi:hypothetical protein